jgi:myo-inositol-1-phosphate synthase
MNSLSFPEPHGKAKLYCSASRVVDKLIDALVESEINTLTKSLEKYKMVEGDYEEMAEVSILEGVQKYKWTITHDVKKQLKEKLKDLTVDEVIKKVQTETKSAYKAAAKKKFTDILENVWA